LTGRRLDAVLLNPDWWLRARSHHQAGGAQCIFVLARMTLRLALPSAQLQQRSPVRIMQALTKALSGYDKEQRTSSYDFAVTPCPLPDSVRINRLYPFHNSIGLFLTMELGFLSIFFVDYMPFRRGTLHGVIHLLRCVNKKKWT
jgi:hypothetical protein